MLRTNENSWPFLEPVTEELAPRYFSIIEVTPIILSALADIDRVLFHLRIRSICPLYSRRSTTKSIRTIQPNSFEISNWWWPIVNSTMANEAVSRFSPVHCSPFFLMSIVLVLGRLATRLLRYFKDCWSECQPMTPQLDDDFDDVSNRENPLKRRLHESSSTIVTRDKNNNTKPRKNYRQLAGLSDDDDDDHEADYVPMPTVKRVGRLWTTKQIDHLCLLC